MGPVCSVVGGILDFDLRIDGVGGVGGPEEGVLGCGLDVLEVVVAEGEEVCEDVVCGVGGHGRVE